MLSHQCSQLSTSDSILKLFKKASKVQENNNKSQFVSVVVLDEVGLAEDSPNLPLKVLHPFLEDGTEGNSYSVDVSIKNSSLYETLNLMQRLYIVKKEWLLLVSLIGHWILLK